MKKSNFFISFILTGILVFAQASAVFAAPTLKADPTISGTVQSITLDADPNTALTTVLVTLLNGKGELQTVRINLETATTILGLVTLDGDGNPVINELMLGQAIEVDVTAVIEDEKENPVGNALSTFFSDIDGLDYSVIMDAHANGNGFGVIAQALWLTRKLGGTADDFLLLLEAKKNNDFSSFVLEDGSTPTSWGQLKKAIAASGNLGVVVSHKGGNGNGAAANNGDKDNNGKNDDKSNNGKGNDNGNNGKKP